MVDYGQRITDLTDEEWGRLRSAWDRAPQQAPELAAFARHRVLELSDSEVISVGPDLETLSDQALKKVETLLRPILREPSRGLIRYVNALRCYVAAEVSRRGSSSPPFLAKARPRK